MDQTLYEIGDDLQAVLDDVRENDGVLDEELEARLDEIEGKFEEKVERVCLAYRNLEAEAEMVEEEAARLEARADRLHREADGLKNYLHAQLRKADRERVEGKLISVRRQENSRPSITWNRPDTLPPEWFARVRVTGKIPRAELTPDQVEELEHLPGLNVKVEADTQAAYEEWKSGGELPDGFHVERGEHVRIW